MSAFQSILLITNKPNEALLQHFNINLATPHLDHFVLNTDKSIGIDLIRDAQKFATTRPVINSHKHIIIPAADRLTIEAQNALLKILEEPPQYLHIILVIKNRQQLLDTVVSRCHIITDPIFADYYQDCPDILTPLLQIPPPQRLNHLPPVSTKEAAQAFCQQLITSATTILHSNPSTDSSTNLDMLLNCLANLDQNANPTLAITDVVLSLLPLSPNPATMAQLPEKPSKL